MIDNEDMERGVGVAPEGDLLSPFSIFFRFFPLNFNIAFFEVLRFVTSGLFGYLIIFFVFVFNDVLEGRSYLRAVEFLVDYLCFLYCWLVIAEI